MSNTVPNAPLPERLLGRDTDWDKYEHGQVARLFKSYQALGINYDTIKTAAEECARWNRKYRELAWENAREALSDRADITARSEGEAAPWRTDEIPWDEPGNIVLVHGNPPTFSVGSASVMRQVHCPVAWCNEKNLLSQAASVPADEVERALVEVVALCPNSDVEVTARAASWSPEYANVSDSTVEEVEPRRYDKPLCRIEIDGKGFSGATLAEAMQAVREWQGKQKDYYGFLAQDIACAIEHTERQSLRSEANRAVEVIKQHLHFLKLAHGPDDEDVTDQIELLDEILAELKGEGNG